MLYFIFFYLLENFKISKSQKSANFEFFQRLFHHINLKYNYRTNYLYQILKSMI
jgi:hypothetical protein